MFWSRPAPNWTETEKYNLDGMQTLCTEHWAHVITLFWGEEKGSFLFCCPLGWGIRISEDCCVLCRDRLVLYQRLHSKYLPSQPWNYWSDSGVFTIKHNHSIDYWKVMNCHVTSSLTVWPGSDHRQVKMFKSLRDSDIVRLIWKMRHFSGSLMDDNGTDRLDKNRFIF